MSLNSWDIKTALVELGFKGRSADNAYAVWLKREDIKKPLYVKRKNENDTKPVGKSPLVLHPACGVKDNLIQIEGCTIDFEGYRNTSLNEFPKAESGTPYGYAVDVKDKASLVRLVDWLARGISQDLKSGKSKNTASTFLGHPDIQDKAEKIQPVNTAEREAIVKVRHGQGGFRELLIQEAGMKCWMTGVESRALLIASHIKPWSRCDDETQERGNRNNGLLLSALWDAAFDAGLISFDEQWQVLVSPDLDETAKHALNLQPHSALPEKFRNDERQNFLAFHRAEIFRPSKSSGRP